MSRPAVPPCPCRADAPAGAPRPAYEVCCGRWHDGPLRGAAPDAETLMRARYSAFVRERADVLLDTWHPTTRPATIEFEPGRRWLGLDVRRHVATGTDRASVEFVARSRLAGRASRLHETSRFVRDAGRWLYLDGDLLGADPRGAPPVPAPE